MHTHTRSLLQVHCVVLKLPLKTCGARAAQRNGHEGGVQGAGAYPIGAVVVVVVGRKLRGVRRGCVIGFTDA